MCTCVLCVYVYIRRTSSREQNKTKNKIYKNNNTTYNNSRAVGFRREGRNRRRNRPDDPAARAYTDDDHDNGISRLRCSRCRREYETSRRFDVWLFSARNASEKQTETAIFPRRSHIMITYFTFYERSRMRRSRVSVFFHPFCARYGRKGVCVYTRFTGGGLRTRVTHGVIWPTRSELGCVTLLNRRRVAREVFGP